MVSNITNDNQVKIAYNIKEFILHSHITQSLTHISNTHNTHNTHHIDTPNTHNTGDNNDTNSNDTNSNHNEMCLSLTQKLISYTNKL